jgi:NhaP-type Na+/H+ or K+/H+ antiporter
MESGAAIFFSIVVIYTVIAVWLGRQSITMPMVFVVVGALFGSQGLGWFDFSLSSETIKRIVEITLAMLLFADSSTLSLRRLGKDAALPARLLLIALPLIIFLGGIIAFGIFPAEGLGFALLIGAILAPTDAALGLPIFTNRRVPARIRLALNVESGLNDGIATPFVALFSALAIAEMTSSLANWLTFALIEIAIGVAVGAAVGSLGGWALSTAMKRRLTSHNTEQIGVLMLALAAYTGSFALSGNGFIAAFVGGMFFGYITRHHQHWAVEFTETVGTMLSVFVWAIFGAYLVIPLFTEFNPLALLYAMLSLTVIRMLPVAVSLSREHLRRDTVMVMGWLGPRGLASVVFTLIAYEDFTEAGRTVVPLFAMAGWTILLSVLLHGFSAQPLARWYANQLKTADPSAPELMEAPELEHLNKRQISLSHVYSPQNNSPIE